MLKILINASSVKIGGALTYIQNLAEGLLSYRKNFEFIFCLPKNLDKDILFKIKRNYRVILVNNKSYFTRFYFDQIKTRKIIKKEKIDILFSTANFATLFSPCKQILLIRNLVYFSKYYLKFRKDNSKEISFYKKIKFKINFFLYHLLTKVSVKVVDIVMTPTQSMLNFLKDFIKIPKEKKIYINYYGTIIEKFKAENLKTKFNNKIIKILYAQYGEHKNFRTLLKALILLKKEGIKNFQLIALFDLNNPFVKNCFNYQKDRDLILSSGIKDNLKFLGRISYKEIHYIYQKADIFVWPTLIESFGHPLLEAMASNLPIIASDISTNREIAGKAALYFKPLNPRDLCDKIKLLISDKNLQQKLINNSKKRVQEFKWVNHTKRLIEIFKSL